MGSYRKKEKGCFTHIKIQGSQGRLAEDGDHRVRVLTIPGEVAKAKDQEEVFQKERTPW